MSFAGAVVSPFRHIYGEVGKVTDSWADVLVSSSAVDSNMLAVNARFIAVPWEVRGGGSFCVVKRGAKGRIGTQGPMYSGHKGGVIDVAFNPFNDFVVASASEDATIKLWKITESGDRVESSNQPYATLTGHSRRANRVVFNPLVDGALASFGGGNAIKLWDVNKGVAVTTIKGPANGQFLDINWSQDGNRLVLPAKDKKLHMYDVRSGNEVFAVPSHYGLKGSRAVFYDKLGYVVSTGFGQSAVREIFARDVRNPEKALMSVEVDNNAGILIPFMDADAGVLYTFGRGDTSAKYFELRAESPEIFTLSQYAIQESIRAVAMAPKYVIDTGKCELTRFYVITISKALLPVGMIVPRRNADSFQEDLYPETVGPEAAIGFDEWKGGKDGVPKMISLEHGFTLGEAKEVAMPVGDDTGALHKEIDRLTARVAELEAEVTSLKA